MSLKRRLHFPHQDDIWCLVPIKTPQFMLLIWHETQCHLRLLKTRLNGIWDQEQMAEKYCGTCSGMVTTLAAVIKLWITSDSLKVCMNIRTYIHRHLNAKDLIRVEKEKDFNEWYFVGPPLENIFKYRIQYYKNQS